MRKATLHLGYGEWDDHSLSTLAGRTLVAMTGNANFPNPTPSIEEYSVLVNNYIDIHRIASNGGSQNDRKIRDKAREALLNAMKILAFHVTTVANGDAAILTSSGFELVSDPKTKPYPHVVLNVRISDGRISGEVRFMFDARREAEEYEYQYTSRISTSGNPEWGELHRTSTSRANYIGGLIPGEKVYIHVRGRNKKGIGDWSETAWLIVR